MIIDYGNPVVSLSPLGIGTNLRKTNTQNPMGSRLPYQIGGGGFITDPKFGAMFKSQEGIPVFSGAAVGGNNPLTLSDKDIENQIALGRQTEASKGLFGEGAEHLSNLLAEQRARQSERIGAQQEGLLSRIGVGQPGGGGIGGGGFDLPGYLKFINQTAGNQRGALENIYAANLGQGTQAINEQFAKLGAQQANEQAAMNIGTSPEAMGTRATLLGQQGRTLGELISNLQAQKGMGQLGVEQDILKNQQFGGELGLRGQEAGQRFQLGLGGLLQGGQQFGQTFGLSQQEFDARQRQISLENQYRQRQLDVSELLGRLQAEAQEPSLLGKITGILGGVGGIAGGVGGLLGGIGNFRRGKGNG